MLLPTFFLFTLQLWAPSAFYCLIPSFANAWYTLSSETGSGHDKYMATPFLVLPLGRSITGGLAGCNGIYFSSQEQIA